MALAMEVATLLTEIAVDLFDSDYENPVTNIEDKRLIALHIQARRTIFDVCCIYKDENDPLFLHNYNMASLIEILPLAALYNCSSMIGLKIAYFLSQLNDLKSKPGFNFAEWLNIDMLQVYHFDPVVFN